MSESEEKKVVGRGRRVRRAGASKEGEERGWGEEEVPTSLRLSISALLSLLTSSSSLTPSCVEHHHERPWTKPQTNFNMELH